MQFFAFQNGPGSSESKAQAHASQLESSVFAQGMLQLALASRTASPATAGIGFLAKRGMMQIGHPFCRNEP